MQKTFGQRLNKVNYKIYICENLPLLMYQMVTLHCDGGKTITQM